MRRLMRRYLLLCCFFFQAEDGIRDVAVTGVQTCALPISRGRRTLGRKARNGLRRAYRWQAGELRAVQRALAGRSNRKNDRVSRAKGIRARREIGRASCRERV